MKSKRIFSIYFILCLLLVFNPSTSKASTIGGSSSDKFTVQEMQILNSLTASENEVKLNFTNNQISNENGELEESSSPSLDKNNNKIKTSHLRTLLKEDPSLVQIQLFDSVSGNLFS